MMVHEPPKHPLLFIRHVALLTVLASNLVSRTFAVRYWNAQRDAHRTRQLRCSIEHCVNRNDPAGCSLGMPLNRAHLNVGEQPARIAVALRDRALRGLEHQRDVR